MFDHDHESILSILNEINSGKSQLLDISSYSVFSKK